jgi:structural maintenance of chromosomes protein 5
MSYKNTSIPLRSGLNLIIGPNGAGKSSILLAISVVLGQAYTERAKKLSELIRWNEQEARISILLDNEAPKGARPFPQARSDKVLLTRVLKRSGDYHYLMNNKPISKTNLVEGLSKIGLNPDNMLVIMHQLMVGRFGSVSPIDKLLLLEDAVGFGAYRREVLEASNRLQKLTTERETMASVLEGTKETYLHWQREYEKYELKRKLEDQYKDLQRELIWRRMLRRETSLKRVKDRIASLSGKMDETREEFETSHRQHQQVIGDLANVSKELESLREEHLKLEHGRGVRTGALEWITRMTKLLESQKDVLNDPLSHELSDLTQEQEKISLSAKSADQDFEKVRNGISDLTSQMSKNTDLLIESRVKKEVSNFKLTLMEDEIKDLEVQLRIGQEEIEPLRVQASQMGPVFENPRDLQQIALDVASVQEQLRPLAHLSEEVEKMYKNYEGVYADLKKKVEVVEHNRSEVLGELKERFDRWKMVMDKLLEELSERYNALLSEVGSKGKIVIRAAKDIEKAGLELYAGFKGNEPVSLDGLAPSGGERTVALIAFLLSLQQFISSPFRAIDEFDVHMDPRNRETVSRLIHAASKSTDSSQYIAITPGQVTIPEEDNVHVIVVQNIEGSSIVKELTQ